MSLFTGILFMISCGSLGIIIGMQIGKWVWKK